MFKLVLEKQPNNMNTLIFKMYSSLIGGFISTMVGLFLFIWHINITTAHFLIYAGLFNFGLFFLMYFMVNKNKSKYLKK